MVMRGASHFKEKSHPKHHFRLKFCTEYAGFDAKV